MKLETASGRDTFHVRSPSNTWTGVTIERRETKRSGPKPCLVPETMGGVSKSSPSTNLVKVLFVNATHHILTTSILQFNKCERQWRPDDYLGHDGGQVEAL